MTPAGTPPPGIIPNLVNPSTQGPTMIIVGSILLFFMLVFASMRFFTKLCIVRRTTLDDCESIESPPLAVELKS